MVLAVEFLTFRFRYCGDIKKVAKQFAIHSDVSVRHKNIVYFRSERVSVKAVGRSGEVDINIFYVAAECVSANVDEVVALNP